MMRNDHAIAEKLQISDDVFSRLPLTVQEQLRERWLVENHEASPLRPVIDATKERSPVHEAALAMQLALKTLDTIAAKHGGLMQGTNCDTLQARRVLTAALRRFDVLYEALLS